MIVHSVLDFVHKSLQRIIQSRHEAPQVDWGGGAWWGTKSGGSEYWIGLTGVLRGETLVSVGQNILVLVALPLMEHLPGVHVVRVVLAAVSG